MHAKLFLHKLLSSVIHLKRLETLKLMVEGALNAKKLSVTQLGRALETHAQEKSNILRSDRFIGNRQLYQEKDAIVTVVAQLLMGNQRRPCVVVDWTKVPYVEQYILRAGLVREGRALVLYEQVHAKKYEGNAQIHKAFLHQLKMILPLCCRPILITDAGFHNPWFKDVLALGWDYVGRIRGNKRYQRVGEKVIHSCKALHENASGEGVYVGEVELGCRQRRLKTHLYLIKKAKKLVKHRKKKYVRQRGGNVKKYKASANEPWLLASSLQTRYSHTKKVFKLYAARMQIEESIRDLKSTRYGFSFEQARSRNSQRIEILLLINLLASLIAWITGWIAEKNHWHYQFQANSIKERRVLSLFFLGCQVIKKKIHIPLNIFFAAFEDSREVFQWTF